MKKTVAELITMYEGNILHTDQTTQRKFIYADVEDIPTSVGMTSHAGDLITSIMDRDIQLPALYFWRTVGDPEVPDYAEDQYNIHDGKQRFLSIYYFVKGHISAVVHNKECRFSDLSVEDKKKLLTYTFDIVVREGTKAQEEESFILINTRSIPLTMYEALRGAYYGKFFTEFEAYVNSYPGNSIKNVGRGEQAIWLLYTALGIVTCPDRKQLSTLAKKELSICRNDSFDRHKNNFDKIIEVFCKLQPSFGGLVNIDNNKNPHKMWRIATFIVDNYAKYIDKIVAYYAGGWVASNDIKKWKYEVHVTAIKALVRDDVHCAYNRFFSDDVKRTLFEKSHKCARCGKTFNYNDLDVDHILPWSKGGMTILDNAQLMCRSCNASKGKNN